MSMNVVVISGRLTSDPKFAPGKDGDANKNRCGFTVAVKDVYASEDRADFVPCVAWGKTADNISKYCKKGKEVTIKGHLRTNSVTNADGTKSYYWETVVESVQFGADAKNQTSKPAEAPAQTAAVPPVSPELMAAVAAVIAEQAKKSEQQTQMKQPTAKSADPFAPTVSA